MKLVLLKKLKQSQQLKENVAVLPPSIPASALPPSGLPSGLSITPTTVKIPAPNKVSPAAPQIAHSRHSVGPNANSLKIGVVPGAGACNVPNIMRTVSIILTLYLDMLTSLDVQALYVNHDNLSFYLQKQYILLDIEIVKLIR